MKASGPAEAAKKQLMRNEQELSGVRLRLLAVVLALALTWYALNPAPGPIRHVRRGGDEGPDEKRRERKSRAPEAASAGALSLPSALRSSATRPPEADEVDEPDDLEELDWPEYLSLD
jgi:hypothetical protein